MVECSGEPAVVRGADRLAVTSPPVAGTDDGDEVAQVTSRVAVLLDHDEADLRDRPLSLRCLVELLGAFLLTLVAAGAGVINTYVGSEEISRGRPSSRPARSSWPSSTRGVRCRACTSTRR